jgi:hypothetical protein
MKRTVIKEIENCNECPILILFNESIKHYYICEELDKTFSIALDTEKCIKVEKELKEWFKNCPKWLEYKE